MDLNFSDSAEFNIQDDMMTLYVVYHLIVEFLCLFYGGGGVLFLPITEIVSRWWIKLKI